MQHGMEDSNVLFIQYINMYVFMRVYTHAYIYTYIVYTLHLHLALKSSISSDFVYKP